MRRAIDRRSRQMKDVLLDEDLRKEFLKGAPKNDAKVVKAFVAANASNALKTRPKVCYPMFSLLFACVQSITSYLSSICRRCLNREVSEGLPTKGSHLLCTRLYHSLEPPVSGRLLLL